MLLDSPSTRRRTRTLAGAAALLLVGLLAARGVPAQTARSLELAVDSDEKWWVGVISESHRMPFTGERGVPSISRQHVGNQVQPLLVSTNGRYAWSESRSGSHPDGTSTSASDLAPVQSGRAGTRCGRPLVRRGRFFPPSGRARPMLFTQPQFNTWIELTYDQNQRDVLAYAHAIVAHGFPPAVLMIDEGWVEGYGVWDVPPRALSGPEGDDRRAARAGLQGHAVGLSVHPARRAAVHGARARRVARRVAAQRDGPRQPAIVQWWDGFSAVADLTSPEARWFTGQLRRLVEAYGVDGFKFDGADAEL